MTEHITDSNETDEPTYSMMDPWSVRWRQLSDELIGVNFEPTDEQIAQTRTSLEDEIAEFGPDSSIGDNFPTAQEMLDNPEFLKALATHRARWEYIGVRLADEGLVEPSYED